MNEHDASLAFETPRVRARLLREEDLDLYLALYTDPSVMRFIGEAMSREEAAHAFSGAIRHNMAPAARARYWRLAHRRTGCALGMAALVRDTTIRDRAELGMMLLPASQGTGAGLQVLHALLHGVFAPRWKLGVREITAKHHVRNASANRLVEHLGFEKKSPDSGDLVLWCLTIDRWRHALALRGDRYHS